MPKSEPSSTSSNWHKVDPGEQDTHCNLLMWQVDLTAWPLYATASPWAVTSTVFNIIFGVLYRRCYCFNTSLFSLLLHQNKSYVFISHKASSQSAVSNVVFIIIWPLQKCYKKENVTFAIQLIPDYSGQSAMHRGSQVSPAWVMPPGSCSQ